MSDYGSILQFCSDCISDVMQTFGSLISQEKLPRFYISGKEDFGAVMEEARRIKQKKREGCSFSLFLYSHELFHFTLNFLKKYVMI